MKRIAAVFVLVVFAACGESPIDEGWEAYRREGPDKAREAFMLLTKDPKRSAEAELALAEIALEQDELKEAASRFQSAAAKKELFADAYAGLGEALYRMGRQKEAYEVWIKALERKPDGAHTERIGAMTGKAYHTTRLTRDGADSYFPRFHPDGKSVVFTSHRYESGDLFLLRLDDMKQERLTDMDDSNEISPVYSPDGSALIFAATEHRTGVGYITLHASGSSTRRIVLMKRDSADGTVSLLTPNPSSVANPFHHPSKERIAFEAAVEENLDIWTMDVEGGGRVRLTTGPEDDGSPVYTPDGRSILFVQTQENNFELMLMKADGTGLEQATRTPYNEFVGSFSPDGRLLVYFRQRDSYELALMDWKTRRSRVLCRLKGDAMQPSFSPDGRRIVFVSNQSDYMELYLLDLSRPVSGASILVRLRSLLAS